MAFPSWAGLTTIYYDPAQDNVDNQFILQGANEIRAHLELVATETTFSIVTTPSGTGTDTAIFLVDDAALPEFADKNDEAFKLFSDASGVYITGKTPLAVRHGAYAFLEKLGFRWFFKSPAWSVVPDSLVDPGDLDEVKDPWFLFRRIWHAPAPDESLFLNRYDEWQKRNRLRGASRYDVFHNFDKIIPKGDSSVSSDIWCPNSGNRKQFKPDHTEVLPRAIAWVRGQLETQRQKPPHPSRPKRSSRPRLSPLAPTTVVGAHGANAMLKKTHRCLPMTCLAWPMR